MAVAVASLAGYARRQTKPAGAAYAACLEPLLKALRWRGTPRRIAEAMDAQDDGDLLDFRSAMANLDFDSRTETTTLGGLDPRLLPCLFVPEGGSPTVVLGPGGTPGALQGLDGSSGATVTIDDLGQRGTACFFTLDEAVSDIPPAKGGWLRAISRRFEGTLLQLLGLGFFLSLLALLPAFFVQAVYDRVLATHERLTLGLLAGAVVFALLCDAALRLVRAAALAHIGGRLDFLIGSAVFAKLLSLPMPRLEQVGAGTQIARLREFEGVRSAFTGPVALAVLELPFTFVFVVAIAAIGGWLALVPVALVLMLAGLGLIAVRYARSAAGRGIARHGDYQSLLVEMLSNMRSIKAGASEAIWLERFRERAARATFLNLAHARLTALTENMAQAMNLVAGAATLSIGAIFALDGSLSVGALIASMTLVWRMLAPIQALFIAVGRLEEIGNAARGIDQMMALPSEAGPSASGGRATAARGRRFAGRITFQRVVLRYAPNHEPAVGGVTLDVKPGQIVAITGGNGSGKSSILKLVPGLYQPQVGAVLIDGVDVRQLNPVDLRHCLAYLPQHTDLFGGTIADNLRLAQPAASEDELRWAVAKTGLASDLDALPAGLDTPADSHLPAGIVRKIGLARVHLMDASIVLLDEPPVAIDDCGDDLVLEQLEAWRGRATVLLVTHHPAHVLAADRAIVLRQGMIVHDGSPQNLMAKLAGEAR